MDNQTLLYIMTAFVVIAGVSLLLQLGMIFALYRTSKRTGEKVTALMPRVESLLASSQTVLDQSKQQVLEIAKKTNDILDITKRQLVKVEEVLVDASGRAKVQMDRAELVIDDTVTRAHETIAMVHNGITRPIREVHGIAAGIKATLVHMAKGSRPSVAQATHDEEMFI